MSVPVQVRRPGVGSWLMLVRCEAKMVARDTAGLIVPIGVPLLILLMSASTASTEVVVNGRTVLEVFVLPLVFTIVVATVGVVNMPSFLAYYRRSGILRRLAVTPASPAMVLVAQAVVSVVQVCLGAGVALGVAAVFFGAGAPAEPWMAVAMFALVTAAMYAVGMVVAAVAPTPNSAVAIGLVVFFAFGATGGLFGSREALPAQITQIGEWLPFGASVEVLSAVWAGTGVEAAHLVALGMTTVVGAVGASAFFRWE